MLPGELIEVIFTGDVGVNALISGRCFPNQLEEGCPLPALVYREVHAPRGHLLTGQFDSQNMPLYEIEVWALTYIAMEQLAAAVITAVDGFDQSVGSPPVKMNAVVEDGGDDNVGVYGTRRQHMRPLLVRFFYNSQI